MGAAPQGGPGLTWLREVRWPIASAVLDGEAVAGDGSEGIQTVFEARHRAGSPVAFAAFDLLEAPPPGVCLVPVTEDAPALWDTWVGQGGEGIVLKERTSLYRSGVRSPAWLKLKPKLTLEVVVTGGSAERVRWGDWGEAVMLAFRYRHPRTARRPPWPRRRSKSPRSRPLRLPRQEADSDRALTVSP